MKIKDVLAWFLDQWPVKILSLSIAVLLYFFTNLVDMKSESITLPVQYVLPNAMTQAQEYPQTVKLHVRGSSKSMEHIKANELQVFADFSFVHDEGMFQTPVRLRSSGPGKGVDTFDIEIDPPVIQIKLEKVANKDVPVRVVFDGEPRNGHEILNYSVVPSRVKVSGPRTYMKTLEFVETDSVELDSRTSSFTQRIHIRNPSQLLSVSNIETVEIRVDIREMNLPMVFSSVRISNRNLTPNLSAKLAQDQVRVQIEATNSILENLQDENINVSVDLSSISVPGEYELPLEVVLPDHVVLTELVPEKIKLIVTTNDLKSVPSSELQPADGTNEGLR